MMLPTGYKKLTESDKKLFDAFCGNYRAAQDSATEIKFLAVKRAENCLRVDLQKNERRTYQEVFTSTTWG